MLIRAVLKPLKDLITEMVALSLVRLQVVACNDIMPRSHS
jgi:hypothetical protein